MNINMIVCCGLTGGEHGIGAIRLKPSEVGTASDLFGSTYILRMGLHYDRYVIANYLPAFQAVPQVYTAAQLAAALTKKTRASSVTGNIGESIAALVARRKLNARRLGDILPILAPNSAKAPDFIMRLRPMFPNSFRVAVGQNLAPTFKRWPVESKAAGTSGQARAQVRKGLQQLGTYWYERYPHEPSVCGFGIVVCLAYRNEPNRLIRIHVFAPSNQGALNGEIAQYRQNSDRAGFLTALRTAHSPIRGYIHALD